MQRQLKLQKNLFGEHKGYLQKRVPSVAMLLFICSIVITDTLLQME